MNYAVSSIGILGFIVWSLLMFTVGLDLSTKAYFTGVTMIIAIRTSIKIFSWLATIYGGIYSNLLSVYYSLSFILLFTIGGISGVVLSNASLDIILLDTYYVIALFLYVLSLGAVISVFSGYYFYSILILSKDYNYKLSLIQFYILLIGINITFFRMLWLGMNGMRRRYFDYNEQWSGLNKIASLGSFITLVSIMLFFIIIFNQLTSSFGKTSLGYLRYSYFYSLCISNKSEVENLELMLRLRIYFLSYKEIRYLC